MKFDLEKAGQRHTVYAQNIKGQIWVYVNGRNFIYESPEKKKKKFSKGQQSKGADIVAPMPGKITKILKKAGDTVQPGDAVIVMEAMKMEYTLKSEVQGTIEGLTATLGDQVVLGKMLVKMKLGN